jgi:soluble lytic murein transglycosylase-like protein
MRIWSTAGRRGVARLLAIGAIFLSGSLTAEASGMAPPLPPVKPQIAVVAPVEQEQQAIGAIPLPQRKPAFGRPDTLALLKFGMPPVPAIKPRFRIEPLPLPPLMAAADTSQPLSAADADLYKKAFSAQAAGQWTKADELMAQLSDDRLRGHVLYERFVHPSYKTSFAELADWLSRYADQPGAERIYKLAQSRTPKSSISTLRRPEKAGQVGGFIDLLSDQGRTYVSSRKRNAMQKKEVAALNRSIRNDLTRSAPTRAFSRLQQGNSARILDTVEFDQLKAQIAASYMYEGNTAKALDLAQAAARRSGDAVPQAGWVGGLAAWREKKYDTAAKLFEITANSLYASSWMNSAGAYWASRAHMRAGNVHDVNVWLERAAAQPRTFYGLIATRALGLDFDFNWSMPELTKTRMARLQKIPAARRAAALVAAGQYYQAEQELRQIDPGKDKELLEALLAYANHNALPSYAMRLAEVTVNPDGGLYDAALYPFSPWNPRNGYKVDRALIYALIRQESRFNPMAESSSGAAGLMQLMPATASFVSGSRKYREAEGRHSLKDPQVNLDIGQRYVQSLLGEDHVSTELFSLVMAYNAGPGNLKKWKERLAPLADDPLLFVESIPLGETRNFVERVMSNYWIYRLRMGQPTPSLDAVSEGRWAEYVQLDGGERHADAGPALRRVN